MTQRFGVARVAITLGVAGSMAGNVAWAWPSPVLVGVGVGMSLVLPVAVRMWRGTRAAGQWQRAERAAVMGAICFGAALYTLVHTTLLLQGEGLPWVIAWVPATVMELLVVQAARASAEGVTRKPAPKPAAPKAAPQKAAPARRDAAAAVTPPAAPGVTPEVGPAAAGETAEERSRRLAAERQKRRRDRDRDAKEGVS